MKVQQSTDVQFANVQDRDNISKNDVGASKGSDKGTIKSVSGTELVGESLIVQRRNLARKQAFRVVADAFDNEMKIDERLRAINEAIRKISDEICENNHEIEKGYETLKKLQEEFHVDPDSEEHKKLMEYGWSMARADFATEDDDHKDPITKEEYHNLTEYQCKGLYSVYKIESGLINNRELGRALTKNVMAYEQVRIEREKSSNMLDAQNEAENIMDASVKEAIALLSKDAVDHIDEEEKEREEAAKEAAEKKKEEKKEAAEKLEKEAMRQEMIENIRDHAAMNAEASSDVKRAVARRERTEAVQLNSEEFSNRTVISDTTSLDEAQQAVNSEITNILNKLILVPNDIKGSVVDDQV